MTKLLLTGWIAVLLPFSMLYSQNRTITQQVINGDTVFVMNRPYAQWVLNRFDSLTQCKVDNKQCMSVVDDLQLVVQDKNKVINQLESVNINYSIEIGELNHVIDSYRRTEKLNEDVKKSLESEIKKKNFWKGLAYFGIGSTVVTSTIIVLILKP